MYYNNNKENEKKKLYKVPKCFFYFSEKTAMILFCLFVCLLALFNKGKV